MKRRMVSIFVAALLVFAAFEARAADAVLTAKHLVGTWVAHADTCSDDKAEFITFRQNGAVESSDKGALQAVGFWRIADDMVTLNVLASPAFFDETRKEADGGFYAFEISMAPFEVTQSTFEAIGVLGEQVRRAKFTRCPG